MKSIRICVIAVTLLMAQSAFAGQWGETTTGAVVGAIIGRGACSHCSTRNQNIATGVMAVAGGLAGNAYGDRADRQEATQRGSYASSVDNTRVVRTVDVSRSMPSNDGWVDQGPATPVVQETRYVETTRPVIRRVVQPVVRESGCDEEYFHGQFNPEAAQAYCQGKRERERMVREAYAEGLAGR